MDDVNIGINAKGAEAAARGMAKLGSAAGGLRSDLGGLGTAAKGLTAAFAPLLAVFAAVRSIQGVASVVSDSNEAFLVQEKAARGATEAQKEYATQMQVVLGIGDEVSLNLMRQARALGISEENLTEASKAAIGLSKATGAGLEESLKKVNQAMRGNANALAEVIPGLTQLKTEEEKLAAANALITRGLNEQKSAMTGLEGVQTRASNSLGDLMEVIGQILAPMRAVTSQGVAVFAETMQAVLAPAAEFARRAMEGLPAVFEWIGKAIVSAMTMIEIVVRRTVEEFVYFGGMIGGPFVAASQVASQALGGLSSVFEFVSNAIITGITVLDVAVSNIPQIFQAATAQAELYWLQFSESIKHQLTVVIPTYLKWFGDNWLNILNDVFDAGLTVTQNYIKNYADIILSLWDWVSSGFAGGAEKLFGDVATIASRNLLEGFEAQTQALPEIMERQLTSREQQLSEKIGSIGAKLGEEFTSKLNARMDGTEFADKFKSRMDSISKTFEDFSITANVTPDLAAIASLGAGAKKDQASELRATEGRLLTRGRADDPNAKIADNTAETAKQLQMMNARQERESALKSGSLNIEVVGA